MNKMIFMAALMLTACSPKQDKLPDNKTSIHQNTVKVDSTTDNVHTVVPISPPSKTADLKQSVKAPAPKEWVDDYEPCVEATKDTTACQKKAEDASDITPDDKDLMNTIAQHAIEMNKKFFEPCMAKIHNFKKCEALTPD